MPDVIPLERRADVCKVLGGEAGKGDGEVEPHRHVPVALVAEAEHLLVGFVTPFAEQDFAVFQCRRVDRAEPVTAVDPAGDVDDVFARHRHIRQRVAEALQRLRLDQFVAHDLFLQVGCLPTGRDASIPKGPGGTGADHGGNGRLNFREVLRRQLPVHGHCRFADLVRSLRSAQRRSNARLLNRPGDGELGECPSGALGNGT